MINGLLQLSNVIIYDTSVSSAYVALRETKTNNKDIKEPISIMTEII